MVWSQLFRVLFTQTGVWVGHHKFRRDVHFLIRQFQHHSNSPHPSWCDLSSSPPTPLHRHGRIEKSLLSTILRTSSLSLSCSSATKKLTLNKIKPAKDCESTNVRSLLKHSILCCLQNQHNWWKSNLHVTGYTQSCHILKVSLGSEWLFSFLNEV